MNTTTFNGIEIPHTPENIEKFKKAIEEYEGEEEIKVGEEYWYNDTHCDATLSGFGNYSYDNYRKEQDNFLPCKGYTQEQAREYFNKRDARRAAETKLRKIIGDMNKKDGFVYDPKVTGNYFSFYSYIMQSWGTESHANPQYAPTWRYSSKATAEFINENHADLLDIYLERV